MHDLLLARQDALGYRDLVGYARELGLDVERFQDDLRTRAEAGHIAADVDSADLSASRARRPSSSTSCATTARTTSRRSPQR